jgi:hypothetical protein
VQFLYFKVGFSNWTILPPASMQGGGLALWCFKVKIAAKPHGILLYHARMPHSTVPWKMRKGLRHSFTSFLSSKGFSTLTDPREEVPAALQPPLPYYKPPAQLGGKANIIL